jgi:excisionase family DNA binding protein
MTRRELAKADSGRPTIDDIRGRSTCSVDTAAAVLGIGRSTAYSAAHDGSLPVLRVGNRLLVPVAKLMRMLGCDEADGRSA